MKGTPGFRGERLKQAREALGLTILSLADMLDVSRQTVSMYEKEFIISFLQLKHPSWIQICLIPN